MDLRLSIVSYRYHTSFYSYFLFGWDKWGKVWLQTKKLHSSDERKHFWHCLWWIQSLILNWKISLYVGTLMGHNLDICHSSMPDNWELLLWYISVVASFLLLWWNMLKKQLRGEGFILLYRPGLQVIKSESHSGRSLGSCPHSQTRAGRSAAHMLACLLACSLLSYIVQDPLPREWCHLQWAKFSYIN
jgi:hypothetical protein